MLCTMNFGVKNQLLVCAQGIQIRPQELPVKAWIIYAQKSPIIRTTIHEEMLKASKDRFRSSVLNHRWPFQDRTPAEQGFWTSVNVLICESGMNAESNLTFSLPPITKESQLSQRTAEFLSRFLSMQYKPGTPLTREIGWYQNEPCRRHFYVGSWNTALLYEHVKGQPPHSKDESTSLQMRSCLRWSKALKKETYPSLHWTTLGSSAGL